MRNAICVIYFDEEHNIWIKYKFFTIFLTFFSVFNMIDFSHKKLANVYILLCWISLSNLLSEILNEIFFLIMKNPKNGFYIFLRYNIIRKLIMKYLYTFFVFFIKFENIIKSWKINSKNLNVCEIYTKSEIEF